MSLDLEATPPLPPDPARPAPASLPELYSRMADLEMPGTGIGRFVPGEGKASAALMFIGEQPGDQEDQLGKPFVGPAGRLLDRALADAEIPRAEAYVTNAVKRFHFTLRGKKRLHRRPTTDEIRRERWWLYREIQLAGPRLVVALGAVALQSLAGKAMPVRSCRGAVRFAEGVAGFVTVHPSSLLRDRNAESRRSSYLGFVADLRKAGRIAQGF
jgi:DNA polymerase